jgi:hypothetical protein
VGKMNKTKKIFEKKEIEEKGINIIRETMTKNPFLKEVSFYSKKNKNLKKNKTTLSVMKDVKF